MIALGLVDETISSETKSDNESLIKIKPNESEEISKGVEKANQYYDDFKSRFDLFKEIKDKKTKQQEAKILIKKAEDAIKYFGNDCQENKVYLEESVVKLKLNLPPETGKDLLDRGQRYIIERVWNVFPPKVWLTIGVLLFLFLVVIGFLKFLGY